MNGTEETNEMAVLFSLFLISKKNGENSVNIFF